MKREEGESFEHYKLRRKLDNLQTKQKIKGSFFFLSSMPHPLGTNKPGESIPFKSGSRMTRTYVKSEKEKA